jgi:hypothetical protein
VDFRVITQEEFDRVERVLLPPSRARAGWKIDLEAMHKACDKLGLKYPVRIRYMRGRYRKGSHYAKVRPDWHHGITLCQDRSAASTNNTLWHELIHAYQSEEFAERTGLALNQFYHAAYAKARGPHGASYEQNTYEIEAREQAERFSKEIQLIVG